MRANNMHKRDISVVITDLDNTLYDWVEMWYQAFNAMLTKILKEVEPKGVIRDRLIPEIRSVHQRHGTSEYAFFAGGVALFARGISRGRHFATVRRCNS
jgi:phosphoglycolate phosphatase-like HAD superfamily hydrolase